MIDLAKVEPEDFRIRCSQAGRIMADPQKGLPIPKGAISYLKEWYKEQTTGIPVFKGNKYTKKGWEVEDSAIDDYSLVTGYEGLVKNEEFFFNDFTQGTPDVLVGDDLVTDIKAPWSEWTFSRYAEYKPTEKYPAPNANYFWQLQCYLWITGREKSELAYVLKNTPKHLLDNYDKFVDYEAEWSLEDRVAIFEVKRSEEHIKRIEKRVEECREFLDLYIID